MLKCPPKLYTIWYRHHMLDTFFAPKGFFGPQLKITYFGHFWTLNFRKKNIFGLKKPTFKWVYRPQNIILHHFFTCSKHSLIKICPYLKKKIWSQNMWYFEKSQKNFAFFWDFSKYHIFWDQNIFLRYLIYGQWY